MPTLISKGGVWCAPRGCEKLWKLAQQFWIHVFGIDDVDRYGSMRGSFNITVENDQWFQVLTACDLIQCRLCDNNHIAGTKTK